MNLFIFLKSLIECSCLKYLFHPSKWRVELSTWEAVFFPLHRKLRILSISFLIFFEVVHIWPIYQNLDRRVWFVITFLPLKESFTLFQICLFLLQLHLFFPIRVIEERDTKINFKYFNGKLWLFHLFLFFISAIFICSRPIGLAFEKCFLGLDASSCSLKSFVWIKLKQVTYVKNIMVTSAKFTILIPRSTICVPFINYLSCNMCNNIESGHLLLTCSLRIKE